tara:strand:- start:19379 stop:19795 length:417 start_codon:yes stop_codon:yes gene_type:complete
MENITDLSETIKKLVNLDGYELVQDGKQIVITKKLNETLSINDVKALWNSWAKEHGKNQIKVISGVRLKGIKKVLEFYKTKNDWERIFRGIENDSFYYQIMDFDKLYRKEMFHSFYENSEEKQDQDPLKAFFEKHKRK